MKRKPFGAAGIGRRPAVQWPVVDSFAANRGAPLAKVNADLMRPPRLRLAFDQRVITKGLNNTHMRDRSLPLAFTCIGIAAPPSVAPVAYKMRFDAAGVCPAAHHCEVRADCIVTAKLRAKMPGSRWRASEDNQAAGVAVQSVDSQDAAPPFSLGGQNVRKEVRKRDRQKTPSAFAKLGSFVGMPHGRQTGGFFHDNDLVIRKA
jgi:hypothetical protein